MSFLKKLFGRGGSASSEAAEPAKSIEHKGFIVSSGEPQRFDLITAFDAIHDQAKPDVVLREIFAALRPGGTFLMQDILASSNLENNLENPIAAFLYTISTMHCMTVSLAQGGAGLGTCWGRELAEQMLEEAGFRDVVVEKLPHDDMNYYYIARKLD